MRTPVDVGREGRGRVAEPAAWEGEAVLPVFAGVTCFLALIQISCISFGLTGVGMDRSLAFAILIGAAVLAILFASRFRYTAGEPARSGRLVAGAPAAVWLLRATVLVLLAWVAWVWVQLWVLAAYRPVYDWDGLTYHIPAIHEWVRLGRVSFITTLPDVPVANYPMGVELTSFWSHFLLGTSRFVDACSLWYWPLAITALAVTAAVLGARGAVRWLAGALVVGSSVFVSQSVTAYVDPGFACAVMASIAAACVFVFDDRRRLVWKGLLLGAALGLTLGSKGYGLPFVVIVLGTTIVARLRIGGWAGVQRDTRALAVAVTAMLAVGGYWYVRNGLVTGNPIYPVAVTLGDKLLVPGWEHSYWDAVSTPAWLARYPGWSRPLVAWLQLDGPIRGYGWTAGGLGYIWIAGALPAAAFLWFRAVRGARSVPIGPLAFLTAITALLFLMVDARWWARMTLWLHSLGLPCLAVVLSEAATHYRSTARRWAVLVLGVAVSGLAIWESGRTLSLEWQTGRDPTTDRRTAFLPTADFIFPGLRSTPGLEEALDATKIGRGRWSTGHGQLLGGILSLPLGRREIFVLPPETDDFRDPYAALTVREDPRVEDVAVLEAAGVRWFIWDDPEGRAPPVSLAGMAGDQHVYEVDQTIRFHVLRLSGGHSSTPDGAGR